AGLKSLSIAGGSGGNTFGVIATGAHYTTSLTTGSADSVNVGNAGSVQKILGTLTIAKGSVPAAATISKVDDSSDTGVRQVTLSTSPTLSGFGQITGLAPATINYQYASTGSMTLNTGTGTHSIVTVQATGAQTTINLNGPQDVVNVGGTSQSGSMDNIL